MDDEEIFDLVRENYHKANKDYIQEQISIASQYLTDEQKKALDMEVIVPAEIGYNDCANAMLSMWMDNIVTDGEYNRIMDRLNKHYGKAEEP